MNNQSSESNSDFDKRRHASLYQARAKLYLERLWSALVAPLCIIALFIALSWFGLFNYVPYGFNFAIIALFAAAFVYACKPFLSLDFPTLSQAAQRLEKVNEIPHQALSIYDETLSVEHRTSDILWAEHQKRMRGKIDTISQDFFSTDVPEKDPIGLRVLVLLLFVTGFSYSWSVSGGQMTDAFTKQPSQSLIASNLRIDAWVTPPSYINQAPIFLKTIASSNEAVKIIQGSEITVRISGIGDETTAPLYKGIDGLEINLTENDAGETKLDAQTFTIEPEQNGTLLVTNNNRWLFEIIPDLPPEIEFSIYPEQALNGTLELAYQVTDDFGLAGARAEIIPLYPPDDHALPLYELPTFDLVLPRRNSADGQAEMAYDLTEHPLAGEEVIITLIATDGAGQETQSTPLEITLPEKGFSSPLARSMIEQRKVIAFDAYDVPRAIELNDALTILPEETIPNISDFLLIKTARTGLDIAHSDEALLRWVDDLWTIALLLENGNLSLAEQRLRDAQRELSEALERGASEEEISQLMDELREAMQEFLEALAQQQQNNPQNAENQNQNAQELQAQDLSDMLDQIEDMARSGNEEMAQQMLQELQDMLNNLQTEQQNQQAQNGEPSEIEQQLDELGQILQQQQQLMDQTFNLDQQLQDQRQNQQNQSQQNQQSQNGENQPNENRQGDQQDGQQGDQGEMSEQELADALEQLREQQEALQQQLQDLMERMQEEGLDPTEGLGEAGEAMGEASGELGEGQTGPAGEQQGRALQALRDGAQQMLNQLQERMQAANQGQQPGQQGQGQQPGGLQNGGQRDPLGRLSGSDREGLYGQNQNSRFSDKDNVQRAREILEIIRKRLGENFRLDFEKEYLERLLNQTR